MEETSSNRLLSEQGESGEIPTRVRSIRLDEVDLIPLDYAGFDPETSREDRHGVRSEWCREMMDVTLLEYATDSLSPTLHPRKTQLSCNSRLDEQWRTRQ